MKKKSTAKYILFLFISVFSCISDRDALDNNAPDIQAARRALGQSANEILSSQKFTNLKIEIAYMTGFRPTGNMVNNLGDFLNELANKPDGIDIILREIPAKGQEKYSTEEFRQLEEEHREIYNAGTSLGIFILILDGYFNNDDAENFALGGAYRNTSVVLFGKRLLENSAGFGRPSRATLESTVVMHEFGHLLGLVNIGTGMVSNHEDEDNHAHCHNENCLMFWAVETNRIFRFMANTIPVLDQDCRDDLRANGGR